MTLNCIILLRYDINTTSNNCWDVVTQLPSTYQVYYVVSMSCCVLSWTMVKCTKKNHYFITIYKFLDLLFYPTNNYYKSSRINCRMQINLYRLYLSPICVALPLQPYQWSRFWQVSDGNDKLLTYTYNKIRYYYSIIVI